MKKIFSYVLLILLASGQLFAATITSNGTGGGSWSAGATWAGGVKPADDDAVTIAAGDSVLMDEDTSGFANGLQTVTITGIASGTPAMLYFKNGTSGHLKLKTGYAIVGTNQTVKGRLLANSDGVWGNTGDLAFANKAIIATASGTSTVNTITATYLDIALYCTSPTNTFVRTYYDKYTVSSINTGTNVITMGSAHGWSANRAVSIRSSGTLPAPLLTDVIYYVGSPSGADLKLLNASGGTEIDITSSGTGTIEIYSGYETYAGVTTVNVLEDVSADTPWLTFGDGTSNAVLADVGSENYDQQRVYVTGITAGTVTLSAALDSAQYPGARINLVSRNVELRSESTGAQAIVYGSTGNTFKCSFRNIAGTGTTFYGYAYNSSSNNTANSCTFSGINYVYYNSSNNNTATSCTFSGINYAYNNSSNNTATSCTFSGLSYYFRALALNNILRNCLSSTNINSYSLNANYTPGRIKVENLNRVYGAHRIFDNFGNITKTTCDGTGDAPSVDPDGGNGYCIAAESIQSNCNSVNPLVVLEEQKIWLTAAEHTVTYNVQTTYAGITAGNLTLSVQYLDTGGAITTATHAPAISQRSDDTDWTQTLTVTFTSAVEGWARVKIVLTEYESGNEVYVWPIPVITGKTFTSKWVDGEPSLIETVAGSSGGGSWGF